MSERCLFCDNYAIYTYLGRLEQEVKVECPNCGCYNVSDIFKDQDKDVERLYFPYRHLISGLIREKNDLGLDLEMIKNDNIESLLNDPNIPKTISQKLDKILLYYYRGSDEFGSVFRVDKSTPYSIGFAHNYDEFKNMVLALIDIGLFTKHAQSFESIYFTVSLEGLIRAEEISTTNKHSNKVFVAMGFKDDLLDAYKHAIQPACRACGFNAFIIMEKEHNGDITDRIISEIKTSKFVVTDFTYNNQGAYFEAGYAQGRGLEVIRTCKKEWFDGTDDKGVKNYLHFDINHYNFILWNNYEDLHEKLINRIRATIL